MEFSCLNAEQVKTIITACVVDKDRAQALTSDQLGHLDHLIPGLIRAAVQSLRLRGFKARTQRLLDALKEEQRQQTEGVVSQPMGFVQ